MKKPGYPQICYTIEGMQRRRFPDHGVVVVWVGPWLGLICFTQAAWGPVEPNATGLPSELLP